MRRSQLASLILVLMLAALHPLKADDQAAAHALLDQAIKAAGGQETLAKFPAVCMKTRGVFYSEDKKLPYAGEWCFEGYDRLRSVSVTTAKDSKSTETKVVNGDKGWIKVDDNATQELDKEDLAEEKEVIYLNLVTMLAPLTDKAYTLAPLGEANVGDRAAVGLKVSHKGYRDVKLFFDKKNWMLLKTERMVKSSDKGKEETEEGFFHDYKDVQGIQTAMKIVYKYNGKLADELEVTEARYLDKPDQKLFTKP